MAAVKTTTKKTVNNKLKAGQKKPINKWLILAGVALVAVIGVVVVRYSGASGEVWSPRSFRVAQSGGVIKTKDNGSAYWVNTQVNGNISITTPSRGTYCIKGSFQSNGAKASIYYYDSSRKYHALGTISGNKGQTFNTCNVIPASAQYTAAAFAGTIVVNRFEKR